MATRIAEQWPGIEQLLAGQPDLVLVALGVPRQETWIQHLHPGQPGLWMGVGGSFDVWSGTKQRAPSWMGRLQIEWLYRLIQEPSRWRRMLALPAFAWAVLRRALAGGAEAAEPTEACHTKASNRNSTGMIGRMSTRGPKA